jgi:hypothetical protein
MVKPFCSDKQFNKRPDSSDLTFKKTNGNPAFHGTPVEKRWIKQVKCVFLLAKLILNDIFLSMFL